MRRIFLILLLIPSMVYSQYLSKEFSFDISDKYSGIEIESTIKEKDSIIMLDYDPIISGFFVSGNIVLNDNERSFVRVTITDEYNNEYLVYEAYPQISDTKCSFSQVGLETVFLDNIQVNQLKVQTHNASITIDSIYYLHEKTTATPQKAVDIRASQCEYIANVLNQNLVSQNKPWTAGVTDIALMSFEDKKNLFGGQVPALYGFDYYKRGVFVMSGYEDEMQATNERESNSSYVSEWDWRNRHGKNWMTSVKNQGGCGSCWAFSAIGTIEPYINLFYNRSINYDLSEQEILSCSGAGTCSSGNPDSALNYVRTYGIVPENCFSYSATTESCSNQCVLPDDRIFIGNYSSVTKNDESVKSALLKSPIAFGIISWRHAIVLAGYKQIHSGENYFVSGNYSYKVTISPTDPLVGHPAWLIKNSWGTSWGDNGYGYVAIPLTDAYHVYNINGGVASSVWSGSDVICEDADNDGYYFWGLGPKPDNCPICCPDIPDGDDSDPQLAEMDNYGNFSDYVFPYPTTIVNNDTTWSTDTTHCGNIIIKNNAILTITAELTMNPVAKIIVQDGGTLIVDEGTIIHASVDVQNSAKLRLLNNGTLYLKQMGNLKVQLGAEAELEYGRVLLQ